MPSLARAPLALAPLALLCLVGATFLVGRAPPAQAEREPERAPRYLVAPGKLGSVSECLYVLDTTTSRLTALRMDGFTRKLAAFASLDVAKDFPGEGPRVYTMETVLHNEALALLYLVEQRSGRLEVYGANTASDAVERIEGFDLGTIK